MFEKKRGKRFLASVMALVMLLSLAPVGALATDETTTEESPAVTQPADEANPKPVVTGGEDTTNTNEEPTPPPSNEDYVETPADNNGASTAISEMSTDTSTKSNAAAGQTAYFYALLPNVVLPSGRYQADNFWYGMGTGSIADVFPASEYETGTKFNDFFETDGKITYPSEFPSLEVGSKKYTYDERGMTKGTYSILWNTVVVEDGANKGRNKWNPEVSSEIKTYHVDGTIILNETDKYTVMFVCQYPNSDKFEVLTKYAYRVDTGYQESALTRPQMGDINGYRFDGWYRNEECTEKVDFNGNGTITENVTYYGKYVGKEYNINYELNGGSNSKMNPDTYTYGVGVTSFEPATKSEYTFGGWYSDNTFKTKVTSISATETGNKTLYAKWDAKTYDVTWVNGQTSTKDKVTHGNKVTAPTNPTKNEDTKYTYAFKYWSQENEGTEASDLTDPVTSNRIYYAVYDKTPKQYTVTYKIGEATHGTPTNYAYDTIVNVESSPVREGYTFSGWKTTDVTVPKGSNQFTMPDKNVVFNGSWTANTNTAYTVEYYQQNLEGTAYALADKKEKTGTTGATVTAEVKDYSGFTYDENNAENVVSGKVAADGKLVLKLYYTRNSYKVSYKLNGSPYITEKTYKYGATVTKEENPTIPEGNYFSGWTVETEGVQFSEAGQFTMPAKNVTVVGTYAANRHTYIIKGHLRDADGKNIESSEFALGNGSQVYGRELSTLITDSMKEQRTEAGKNYVYVPSETTVTVNGGTSKLATNSKLTANDTVINLYYYLDETGKTGKDEENKPTDKPDGIPDAWQYKVTFKVSNGKWDNGTTADVVAYVTNKKDDIPCAKGTEGSKATLDGVTIPGAGSQPNSGYRASGNWDATLSATTVITKENTVFTYNYDQKSGGSGGSGGSSRPTVTIPDNVPTGLNGTDHYAYIIGYGNNDVRPQNNITRAEVATIFFRLLTDETRTANMTKSNSYNDVKDGDWFCCAVSTLSKMGIIKGYEDGSFKPNDPISRAEFAAIAARFDPDGDKTPATFADVTSHWAKDEISIAANHGWIKGYEDGSFKPDQKITRAETMTLVNRVLNRLPETKDDLHKDMKTWVDNMDETAWYYLAVQEATNSHYFKNKTSTKFEQWTDLRDTRDWSELEK